MLSIPLHYRSQALPTHDLAFKRVEIAGKQARHVGRYALAPRVDLAAYRTKAVLDFVEVEIETTHPTDFKALRGWIARDLQLPPLWCTQIDGGKNSATKFRVVIQDPKVFVLTKLDACVENSKAGRAEPVKLRKVEVSVDFFPRSASDIERLAMVGVLQHTYLPRPDVWSNKTAHPRVSWGKTKNEQQFFLPSSAKSGLTYSSIPKAPFLDATVYHGERDAPWMIRIQNKVANHRKDETALALDQHEKRARIEVTLTGTALCELGLNTIKDLAEFKFTQLQGDFFHFALPTFPDAARLPQLQCVQDVMNSRDRETFVAGGVACLERIRAVKEEWYHTAPKINDAKDHVTTMRANMRAWGRKPSYGQVGQGKFGCTASYEELNDSVRSALRDLERRVKGGERRS